MKLYCLNSASVSREDRAESRIAEALEIVKGLKNDGGNEALTDSPSKNAHVQLLRFMIQYNSHELKYKINQHHDLMRTAKKHTDSKSHDKNNYFYKW